MTPNIVGMMINRRTLETDVSEMKGVSEIDANDHYLEIVVRSLLVKRSTKRSSLTSSASGETHSKPRSPLHSFWKVNSPPKRIPHGKMTLVNTPLPNLKVTVSFYAQTEVR